ncbi:MAG: diphthine synthase [Candidatus Thermoplasmatota archaeon]|jgi:diphthine synthase|nr:diphthine synthase [Candidatus Thermoplasmatota archaeon]MDP7264654.1 diphthine synthase [Candidatus Thermoplasmatota archaeon]
MKDDSGRLDFVGLGLWGSEGISTEAISVIREADAVFAEFYTSLPGGVAISDLQDRLGSDIELLSREQVESGNLIMDAALKEHVVFLTGGDSMSATTHVELRLRAGELNIPTRIYHAPSVLTAVPSELGLSHYKFGRVTTLVFPRKNFFPTSPYEAIRRNFDQGLHTLVLMDIIAGTSFHDEEMLPGFPGTEMDHKGSKFLLMGSQTGFLVLREMEEMERRNIITPETLVCAVARAGGDEVRVRAGHLREMINVDMGPPLHSIVIPGNLHFMEARALVEIAGAPRDILERQ